eukprot:TRINITY_DN23297_c1_g1_i1.p1 TRINITY_DN23297_c1_g1~~TRINITY_DN23297_c1_g1_i1.p1  ORF type:complete len:363 (+),score=73.56 TRINITY_DN23297_c1_g1_i1:51-1139(+)
MALETKASVAVDSLSAGEAAEIFKLFGYEPTEEPVRLYGGYASSNFKVVGKKLGRGDSTTLLLKINYYGLSIEDLEHQLFVMNHLRSSSFPTNYPHATDTGALYVEKDGRKAMLLDFVCGKPGSDVLAADEGKAPRLLEELSATLAGLHKVIWPEDRPVRDIRAGYPMCNTGDLLRGEELKEMQANEKVKDHPFVALVSSRLDWLRALYDREVPWGLIHGDAYLDNTMYEDGPPGSGECRLLALIDWEDSCVAPLTLDLAVCASAACFTASNELMKTRLVVLLREYLKHRTLSKIERESFVDYMAAGALACAFYRFGEFHVRQPDSSAEAKQGYKIMADRAELLFSGSVREAVEATLHEVGA